MIDFRASAVASNGTAFDQVVIAEGVQAWQDAEHALSEIPTHLVGGYLLRGHHGSLARGTVVNVEVSGLDARVYVGVEISRAGNADLCPGGLVRVLGSHQRWSSEQTAPLWGDGNSEMSMFSTIVQRGAALSLPAMPDDGTIFLVMVVPIFTGAFSVAVASSSWTSQELALVEEGVRAWQDRDHSYVDVPKCLLGGLLYQGPKDVPDGTVVTVRPNLRSRVYVVTERACSGGFLETLPAQNWTTEDAAPRWHENQTMVMYSRDCAAGHLLVLPSTRGAGTVFSVIVVPTMSSLFAPVEVSALTSEGASASLLELVPLAEGKDAWNDDHRKLLKVPEWMRGATLARGSHAGPAAGSVVSVRAAAPSVVYAVLDESSGSSQPSSGALAMPQALLAAGWDRRNEAPDCQGHTLSTWAKRIPARGSLTLPAFSPETGCALGFFLVVKVDVEAFDAAVETSTGSDFSWVKMAETIQAWNDRPSRWAWVPNGIKEAMLFRGPHSSVPSGTTVRIRATGAFRAYVIVEAEYKVDPKNKGRTELSYAGPARTGGFLKTLPQAGWRDESGQPSWGDISSKMKIFSRRCFEGSELMLPPIIGEVVFSVVIVDVSSSPATIVEELKTSFKAWDANAKGAIRKEDLAQVLRVACPDVSDEHLEALLADADRDKTGRVDYAEFANSLLSA